MKLKYILPFIILLLSACELDPEPDESPTESEKTILISEVMAGIAGNNNYEFIELYNYSDEISDLAGLSLWYRLPTSEGDLLLYQWRGETLIPAHGHYLLSRPGEDIGILSNATFTQSLNTAGGGLLLRASEGASLDALGWGNAPETFTEGSPAPVVENGTSLVRKPGGDEGNHEDTDDNSKDFSLSDVPSPQNTGSHPTPSDGSDVVVRISGPASVEPGTEFEYRVSFKNDGSDEVRDVSVELMFPEELIINNLPDSFEQLDQKLYWRIGNVPAGVESSEALGLEAPWAYVDFLIEHVFAQIDGGEKTVFANPILTRVEGGIIPIGTARGLIGAELTVEGIATMYTGGYFAGGGNVKFYIEDETGGLQVQVFTGEGVVRIPIGAYVRVKGTMGVYRDSLQIVPNAVPQDIEILDKPADPPFPGEQVTLRQAANDFESLPGRLVQVEGTVTRVEEFSYSYEMDLADDEGQLLRLYIDKLTEMSVEKIEPGHIFRATGIIEVRDGTISLNPRLRSDLEQVFPPVLMIQADAPNTVLPGGSIDVSIIATNHSPETIKDLVIVAQVPSNATLEAVHDNGNLDGDEISWMILELEGNGDSATVSFTLTAHEGAAQITIETSALHPENVDMVEPLPWNIFIGTSVPIWAIQGEGFSSPYVLEQVTTQGITTGIFPALAGFWIQSIEADDNPDTSEGLFINIGEREADVAIGDLVLVTGNVREISQQTMLEVLSLEHIQLVLRDQLLPAPVELSPPLDDAASRAYYEALEGMLVSVSEPAVAVSPTTRYGEYSLVLLENAVDRVWRGDEAGYIIMVDDGTFDVHYDSSTMEYAIQTGDQVTDLYGPLAFTFGNYKIEPLKKPTIDKASITFESLAPIAVDEFSIMTWNVENLFDILDPHPTDPPLPRRAEYELSLTKIANTIIDGGIPTIIGLQEVEHIGILEDLASHALLSEYRYVPALIEGTDSRGIDVGYLVRGDRAKILDVQQHIAPEGLTSRPPLLIQVQLQFDRAPIQVFLLNNHFTSMAGGVLATEPRRSAQAAWNVTVLEEVVANNQDAYIAVLGDLNSFFDSQPLNILRQAGLEHVFDILEPDERYTYIFEGASQSLDHILVTANLMQLLERVDILHTNADFPPADPDDPSPIHKSDHDPVIATFRFPAE